MPGLSSTASTIAALAVLVTVSFIVGGAAITWLVIAIAGAVRAPAPVACDDDGTGRCSGCAEIGDDTIAMLAQPDDTIADSTVTVGEVEQWVREWERGGRG